MTSVSPETAVTITSRWRDYYELTKPRVVMLIVFTAMVGMILSGSSWPPIDKLVLATLGIGLVASSAAAINHVVEVRIDAEMARTSRRPVVRGSINQRQALRFAFVLGAAGTLTLWHFINSLTATLTVLSLIGYAFVYTIFLKRTTPQNIVLGGAAGAAPPVLGWTAITGEIHAHALLLFLIIFFWTPPHFWALAIARKEEYANVGIPMLPVTRGVAYTKICIVLYTANLLVVSVLPALTGMGGMIYLLSALALGVAFLYRAIRLELAKDTRLAMPLFSYSITYLMALFTAMLLDHFLYINL